MSRMHPTERVGLDFLEDAPFVFANSVDLAITPEQLFEVFEDAEAWPRWASVITKVTWTSPPPHGIGTTRTVHMRGGLVGAEEFLAWEPCTRMAFRFNEASSRTVAAFAEGYDVVPSAGGCRLTWTMAMKVAGPSRVTMAPFRPILDLTFRRFLRNLRRYTDERFAVTAGDQSP